MLTNDLDTIFGTGGKAGIRTPVPISERRLSRTVP